MSADNQQITEAQIAWLAGIFDGEGSIGIYGAHRRNGTCTVFTPRVSITNTSAKMYDAVCNILAGLNLPKYTHSMGREKPHWKPKWQLIWTGLSRPKKLLTIISPYLVDKAEEADLALEFIERREGKQREKYTPRDLELVELIKNIKSTRHLRD